MPRIAIVGIVGRTNAGKSTLVNRMVGEKVSIVSPVQQTTRNTIRGIVCEERGQLVLLDTPGLHKAEGRLGLLLNRMARRSAAGTDILCVVFDASNPPEIEDTGWMARVAKERPEKTVFVLNKADKKPFREEEYKSAWADLGSDLKVVWTKSIASTEGGANAVLDALFSMSDEGEYLFPPDIATDYPRKLAMADVIREKFLAKLHQELPHELGILVKSIDEKPGRWTVKADVIVNRPSQRPIVLGRNAGLLKNVRIRSQREIGEMFGVNVSLELWVRVEPGWMENRRILSEMGYLGGEI